MKNFNKCNHFPFPCAFPIPEPPTRAFTETSSFAANTGGPEIDVIIGGTIVPLPDFQNLSGGITVNDDDTIFTVPNTGRYYINYQVNFTASIIMGARLLINGSPNTPSTVIPVVGLSQITNTSIVNLNAGDTVSLQLFGFALLTILLPGSTGATLTIIQIS
ncbi:BclA C-terminal domain-containing protein [Bacillus mycoides]|uniref:BclA C-terminal domain-containing protein n=1 Tax=Bacillus mycoides TaxID=1405 RepID=UPI00099461FE|nr:hypothetical protein [Bacillus mycoides]OOR65348.1 hypothetical protein BLW98_27775 [Bacillus mycoides]